MAVVKGGNHIFKGRHHLHTSVNTCLQSPVLSTKAPGGGGVCLYATLVDLIPSRMFMALIEDSLLVCEILPH